MAVSAGSDTEPVEHETRDRVISGPVTVLPATTTTPSRRRRAMASAAGRSIRRRS
jgi:hypothetical protein